MIDLALAKAHLRAEGSAEDVLIQSYLDAAAAHVEGATGKLLARRAVVQEHVGFGQRFGTATGAYLPLWWGPDADGFTIDYLDAAGAAQTVSSPRVQRDRVYAPLAGWPATLEYSPVALTYTAGFGAGVGLTPVPADLVQAQLMLVAHWWNNREAVALAATVAEMPLAVEAILQRHRTIRI